MEKSRRSPLRILDFAITTIVIAVLVAGVIPAMGQSDAESNMVAGDVIVAFEDMEMSAQKSVISTLDGATIIDRNDALNCVLVRTDDEGVFIRHISNSASVRYATPNGVIRALHTPNDPLYGAQWGPRQISADDAWDIEKGGKNITIAIIDTGVDYNHEDLSDNYVNIGYDWVNDDSDPMDDNGHGTHCAGIAAATMDNGKGIAGIAQVNIIAEKMLDSTGVGTDWDLAQAITHATDHNANIISMSLGSDESSQILNDACRYAWDNGCLIVAASGNEYNRGVSYPAAYDTVIAVGATDTNNQHCAFSNWGPELELVAPGISILSCYPSDQYISATGTSMATPHVAGTAALLWSKHPGFTNQDIRDRLDQTASDLGMYGWDEYYGWGLVDAEAALDSTTENPDIWIDPTNIKKELSPGTVWCESLTIGNDGAGALDFEIRLVTVPAFTMTDAPCETRHPIMHFSIETLEEWIESYNAAPRISAANDEFGARGGSHSLLNHIDYTPQDRDQGSCGNCWAWAGTGCMEVTLDVENGVRDRLSVQHLNSNYNGGTGNDYACCGGCLETFAHFYSTTAFAIPWDNTNAEWQDGGTCCGECDWCLPPDDETTVPTADISTTPRYNITHIDAVTITTQSVGQSAAIANIKSVLNNNAVWFAFLLPDDTTWDDFSYFWEYQPETDVWDPGDYCGKAYTETGGGHAVLCVGYDDTDPDNPYWIMLNSWGVTTQRPNGVFRVKMNIDYDCYINHGIIKYPTFYWQMLDIDFETPMPPPNTRPVACFMTSPSSGDPDTVFNFDASCCSDAQDLASNLQVRWDWENDGVYDTPYTIAKTAAHQYISTGTKMIKLQVRDTSGLDDTTTRYVIVSDGYVGWLSAFPTTGTVNPCDQMKINICFNTTGLDLGVYIAEIVIENNDPDEDPVIVPVELTVVDGVCGDVTGEGAVNIVDAMYIAQYTVGNRPSSDLNMENADVNNCDGNVNIVDAMFIAQYTVGTRERLECC